MAYLSDDDQKNQQNQSSGQDNFNILAPASSASGGSSGGNQSSGSYNASSAPQQATTGQASDKSQQNSQDYTQSLSGASSQDMSQPASSAIKPSVSNTGLTSGTSGGGYINFQSYANANPSSAGNITAGGNSLLGSEQSIADKATNVDPNSGFSTPISQAPGSLSKVSSMLSESGPQWQKDSATLAGLLNEHYTAPSVNYTPSSQWQQDAPELSQTGGMGGGSGGSAGPSVIDYLARPDIQAGKYGLGERNLDSALIAGDTKAQAAIANNAKQFGDFQNQTASKVAGLQSKIASNAAEAPVIAGDTQRALNSVQQKNQSVVDAINADNSKTEAQKLAEVKAYQDWMNSSGAATGSFDLNNKVGTAASVDPQTATTLNRIADLQHQAEPYPNYTGSVLSSQGTPSSYEWNVTQNAKAGYPSGLAQQDPDAPGIASFEAHLDAGQQMTPDQVNGFLSKIPDGDLQGVYNSLGNTLLAAQKGGNQKAVERINQERKYIADALTGRQQTPLALAQSLGLSADDMKSLGF